MVAIFKYVKLSHVLYLYLIEYHLISMGHYICFKTFKSDIVLYLSFSHSVKALENHLE